MPWYMPKCEKLNFIFVSSFIIFITCELTKDLPELFKHADIGHTLLSELSKGILVSYFFYIIVVYYPAKKIQRYHISKLVGIIKNYKELYFKEFGCSTQSLKVLYINLEIAAPKLDQRETWAKLNPNDKQKTYYTLYSAIAMFEKELEKYLDNFISSYIRDNDEIIYKMELFHCKDRIIDHYRSNILLRRNTSETYELDFIMQCIFDKPSSVNESFKVKESFKTHIRNCEELIEILNKCYN